MSDDWIVVIPEDPTVLPEVEKQARAYARFAQITGKSEGVRTIVSDSLRFFDCGCNLERIGCPSCRFQIPIAWWQERMDREQANGVPLDAYSMPCCHARHTLHELIYEWPQGFGHYALEAMNPSMGKLSEDDKRELEALLGTRLRVIYQHI